MFWPDKVAQEIIKSGKYQPFWVDDMKTPSGRIHVGALRGVVIHHLIYQALKDQGVKATYSYVFNDMDPMDGFPHYLPKKFKTHMGEPLFKIPSPEKGYNSFAQCYAQQFIDVFNYLGIKPKIIWSHQLYESGKMNSVIKQALDRVKKVRSLYQEISGYEKPKNWYPFQVICPQCGKVGTTITTDWDGKRVSFECRENLVNWAKGCGYQAKISPLNGTGKLMWKVDWAATWKTVGVTIEWSGKDHMSEGGSYDLSSAICDQVFEYPKPHARLYEWFLAKGGKKMSSSKGVGISAKEVAQTLPPHILRFLLVKTHHRRAITFDPNQNKAILDLFDDYDTYAQEFYQKGQKSKHARAWEMSQVKTPPKTQPFYPRFRDVVKALQDPKIKVKQKFVKQKGSNLTQVEEKILKQRVKYAKVWLKSYAPDEMVFKFTDVIPKEAKSLSADQKKYLKEVVKVLKQTWTQPEELQQALYETAKNLDVSVKKAFQAIYLSLIGKTHGPKAAWFLLEQDVDQVIERFKKTSQNT